MKGPTQQGTCCLLALASDDAFLEDIVGFFVESYTIDLGDNLDDFHIFFDEIDPSIVIVRAYSNPHVHSLHDQSSQVGMIMDTYVQ